VAADSPCLKPNLDALAAQGIRFGRCYTPNAVCSPARASLMTGVFPSTHGVWDCVHTQRREWVDLRGDRWPCFSRILADAGYHNGYFGKWHVEQSKQMDRFGWQEHDFECQSRRVAAIPGSQVRVPKAGYRDYLLAAVDSDEGAATHPAFDRGIAFIRAHAEAQRVRPPDQRQPFCCFVSTSEPHDPYVPPKSCFDRYDLDHVHLSPTLRDEPDGKPEVVARMRRVWQDLGDDQWRRITAAYWASITFLDAEVGRIVSVLRETGLDENTLVVFTSDHGDMLGAHGLAAKGVGTAYEEVYNIPLLVRGPGIRHGHEEQTALVNLVDVAPTLLDLCGATPLPEAQGRSFRALLEGHAPSNDWEDSYAEFFGQRFVYTQRIVWHGNWKYIFSPGGVDELYDLAADPFERANRAADPAFAAPLADMTRRMWRKMKAIGDDSLLHTEYATLRTAPVGPLSAND
jgi:arylsulfatase A-like enzyme